MADGGRVARGAAAGAAAAAVWALQQPLDRRVFGVPYSDTELLGKLVTRGPAWPVAGWILHLANGAAFGAGFTVLAPRLGLPGWARGPAAALAEHLASWPLAGVAERVHPAREDLPPLVADPRAFAQATWRHLLFGVVLGELERRLNPPAAGPPDPMRYASTNGHGHLERSAVVHDG